MSAGINGVSYIMLGVTDLERSVAFYTETLDQSVKMRFENFAFIDAGPIAIGLSAGLAATRPHIAGAMEIVFAVDSVTTAHRELADKGVQFLREPRQATDKEWVVTLLDPDGHYISLFGAP